MASADPHLAIETVWRIESARLIAGLARIVRDIGVAEELAQDALVAALEQWPGEGVPRNPGAWLMAAAKHRALDHLRRNKILERKHEEIAYALDSEQRAIPDPAAALDNPMTDDMLRLIFTACHPILSAEARTALTLRLLGGLTTAEIARAFLTSESTVAQRIVRAKRTLSESQVPFEIPRGPELATRLASVLEVLYLIFNEGYTATSGNDWLRPELCHEALRLSRTLAELAPNEPEVHGLTALMELQASRLHARTSPSGEPILLDDQDRAHWDQLLIRRGLAALDRAQRLTNTPGPYLIQASIAACHARALTPDQTDWPKIADLYAELARQIPSPVIELNRAVAVSRADGLQAALALTESLLSESALANYHFLPAVRGDLLAKLGRHYEAKQEFERAAALTQNVRERALLLDRANSQTPLEDS